VIAVDANLLIYASVKTLPQHEASHGWLDRQLNESPRVGLPWASLLAFVRIVSNSSDGGYSKFAGLRWEKPI